MIEYPTIKISELKEHPQNPRNHTDEQIKKIANSIKELGWGRPIIISKDFYILAGHGAFLAAKDILKYTEVPYKQMEHQHDSPEALSYMVADNKLTDESTWNEGKLQPILTDIKLKHFDVSLTGFEPKELQAIKERTDPKVVEEDDFDPDAHIDPITKLGDIYQLGTHRLMCGDSTIKEDVEQLMNGNKADMVFTDPPYGLGGYGGRNNMELKGDDHIDITKFYDCIPRDIKERYIWGNYHNLMRDIKEVPRDVIVWKKNNFGLGRGYRGQYELCFYFGEFNGSDSDVWEVSKDTDYVHPTQKPLKLPARAMNNSTKTNDIVLDLFGGSGSTLIACEQLQRVCYMMELDPHYCDVIIKRWENYTKQEAVKID